MSIFSINNVTVRPTKTMNRANERARIYETSVPEGKVIHTKYSKHHPSTVAHTFECVCSKINHRLNPGVSIGCEVHIKMK